MTVRRRERWRSVLELEVQRWSAHSYEFLIDALLELDNYTVERDSRTYQVEVQLLETTDAYVHVSVSVDDGKLPASLVPATATFVVKRVLKK